MNYSSRLLINASLLLLLGAHLFAQTTKPGKQSPASNKVVTFEKVEPMSALRGENVKVFGSFGTYTAATEVTIELKKITWSTKAASSTQSSNPNPADIISVGRGVITDAALEEKIVKAINFRIPIQAPLGEYEILVTFGQPQNKKPADKNAANKNVPNALTVPTTNGPFRIVMKDAPKITAAYPSVSYPEKDKFSLTITGENFSPLSKDNTLVMSNRVVSAAKVEATNDGRELTFLDIPKDWQGVQDVNVRVGEREAEKPIKVTLSKVERAQPMQITGLALAILVAIIGALLLGKGTWTASGGKRHNVLSMLLLDAGTNSYSLSKFQFYLWTAAVVAGYIYLTITRIWVRGDFVFPDLPDNLPGIIMITVSTTALSIGITSSKGAKGAGEQQPGLSDLIATGGIIASERLQFFVWTLVGVATFVALTLSVEPGKIEQLPAIPEKFLYLMGISSAGYLGGKLARKPGPNVSQIEAVQGSLTLTIHGSGLSPDATFKIDNEDLKPGQLSDQEHPKGKPIVDENDDQPGFAKILRLVISTPNEEWTTPTKHQFTIINPDGQKAVWPFEYTQSSET